MNDETNELKVKTKKEKEKKANEIKKNRKNFISKTSFLF